MSVSWRRLTALGAIAAAMAVTSPATAQVGGAPDSVASAAGPDQSYLFGADDVVKVEVLGRDDFKTQARITHEGTIQLPYIGTVPAANRTASQLGRDVTTALIASGYFEHPVVSVEIVSFASRYVTVLGYVEHPGLVPIDRNYRVSEVLAKVGGASAEAADYVVLRSAEGEKQISIRDLATGDLSQDPYVSSGEKIYVPKAGIFYVSGQVRAPGAYPVTADMTLLMAISRGGGVTDLGSIGRLKVTRQGKLVKVKLTDKVQPGDVINIGERLF